MNETLEREPLASIRLECPWGLLRIADRNSTEEVPPWKSKADQVTGTASSLVVRVRHRDEGDVEVRVWKWTLNCDRRPAFSGEIEIGSGQLRIGDALDEVGMSVGFSPGRYGISVYLDPPLEARCVDIVLDRPSAPSPTLDTASSSARRVI
jgi:hypothetical protein